jgi:hypothetical protein
MITEQEKLFAHTFVRDFSGPFARQYPTGRFTEWQTKYKKISDPIIQAHLRGDYWLGTKASWYPIFFNLDLDHPDKKTLDHIFQRLDKFGIDDTQYGVMTSPSYKKSGNLRIYLRLEYDERPPTHRLGFKALQNNFADLCEIYPQSKRKDRLPCGRNQDLIVDDKILKNLTWEQEFHYLLKLDPVRIENLPHQAFLFDLENVDRDTTDDEKKWKPCAEIAELIASGLQTHGSRHLSQFDILNFLWRSNWLPEDAAAYLKRWIRKRHNGFSKDATAARWSSIDAEIDRQVLYIWARINTLIPDALHNLNGEITKADLDFAAEVFRGNAVKQKQLIKLIAYARPRQHHEYIYIPAHVWFGKLASKDSYKEFQSILEAKGILESVNTYRINYYSKKFKVKLPTTSEQPLKADGRNVTEFYDALFQAFGSIKAIKDATGLKRMTIWRKFQQA